MDKTKLLLRAFPPLLLLLLFISSPAPAQAQATAIVRGTVLDPTGAAIPGARVEMWNPLHPKHRLQTESQPDGTFVFYQVPFNPYRLTVSQDGFQTHQENLQIHTSTLTLEVVLEVGAVAEQVEVTALLSETMISTHVTLDEHELVRKPGAAPSRMIESALLESGGVAQNANGRMHVRGAHYQVSFMIDGLPISDQLSIDFGNPFDLRNVEALEIYTGNFPAEFGNKVSGVVNVSTKSGLGGGDMFHGSIGGSLGSFDTGEGSVEIGGGNKRFGYHASVAGGRSNRFLDPPSLDNLNNGGDNQSLFLRLDFSPADNDFLHFMVSSARSSFDVPNLPSQHLAGQSQEQRLKDIAVRVTWLHVFADPRWTLEVIPYYRTAVAQLFQSPFDTPVTASQARHLTTTGVKSAVSYTNGNHRLKAGIDFFAFPVSEILTFGITDPDFNDPASPEFNPNLLPHDLTRGGSLFLFDDKTTGEEYSFFIQDNITYGNLTASLGIRYDNYNFVLDRNHWSPRLGLAYRLDPTGTVLRASYNRLWQTPSNENLLVSTSAEAAGLVPPDRVAELGAALLIVEPERVNFYEVGAQQSVRDWFRLDGAFFWKRIRNYHDNDQFLNTTIVFPTAISKGRVKGFDFRIDMPHHQGLSAYWNLTIGEAIGEPPLSGGLFVGEEALELLEAGPFRIDHDQTYSSQGNVTYEHETGVWSALTIRYDSGLPVEIEDLDEVRADPDINRELALVDLSREPFRVKSRTIWDWSIGFDFPHEKPRVSFQFDILNLTDETALFNFLSVFSGTHVIRPRTFSGRLRYFF